MAKKQAEQNQTEVAVSPSFNSIRVTVVEKDSLKGMATVKVGEVLFLTGIRIIEGKKGLFVSMPSRKESNGEYKDICFPANKEYRDELQAAVLDAYKKVVEAAN